MIPRREVFTTERLTIREILPTDYDFIQSMLDNTEVMEHFPTSIADGGAHEWMNRQYSRYAAYGHGMWTLERTSDGEPIGQAGLMRRELSGVEEIEIAYLLHRPFWGKGYATEAARGCVKYGLEVLRGKRIFALISAANLPSRAVADRLGMTHIGETEHHGIEHMIYRTK